MRLKFIVVQVFIFSHCFKVAIVRMVSHFCDECARPETIATWSQLCMQLENAGAPPRARVKSRAHFIHLQNVQVFTLKSFLSFAAECCCNGGVWCGRRVDKGLFIFVFYLELDDMGVGAFLKLYVVFAMAILLSFAIYKSFSR